MLDANNDILASMLLHGTGTGAIGQVSPILESSIGSTLITPTQMVTDALDNVYVADPGLKEVVEYSAGSSTAVPIGTGSVTLASPTGVAVDGAGDVFIADSGNVYEVPFGPSGLNAAGIVTLKSGLGSNLSLAADGLGDLYVADPSNGQVLKLAGIGDYSDGAALTQSVTTLTAGFTAPSVVAVDSNNNLYIIDGTKLFEIVGGVSAPINSLTPTTKPTALVSTLTGVTGLATEPSGAVYISSTSGTWRIPLVRGSLSYSTKKAVAPDVTSSSSVALDRLGNVYVTPTGGSSVRLVSATGTLSLSLTPPATSTTATATIMNIGNASLLVSGYTDLITYDFGANVSNFTGADGTCVVDSTKPQTGIAPGNTCNVVVTFDPGAGQSDALTGWVQATSNAANAPITIDTNGTGPILANSQVQVTVGSGPQVIDVPLTVTVIPASGTGTPTGSVQVTYESWTVVVPTACLPAQPPCAPKINPVTVTASSALTPSPTTNSSTAMFTLAPVLAGPQTITVGYTGDRTYNWSTGDSGSVTIAQSAITGFIGDPNPPPYLPFVLSSSAGGGQAVYFDTSPFWTYAMPLTVNTAAGIPTGTITFNDNSSTCPPGTTVNGVGAATCQLANYSGVACPESVGAGVQFVKNNGSAITGGTVTFTVTCLQEPSFTKYTPVVWTHYITSVYSGDQNFIGATDPVSSLFQSLRSPEVSIATSAPSATTASAPPVPSSAGSLTVQAGSTASLPLYITPLMGYGWEGKGAAQTNFNFPVSLQCDNLPPHTTCTFTYPTSVSPYQPSAPNSVQICPEPNLDTNVGTAVAYETLAETGACNANGVGVVTLTINTNVPESTTTSQNASRASITLASIFGLGMVGLFFRRRAFQKAGRLLMFVMMIVGGALSVSLAACSTTNLTLQSQLATPPGTYAVSITAAQVGTQCVPQATGASIPCTTPSGAPGQTVYASNVQVSLPYYINLTVQAAQ
jgi:hypothetical protein